MTFELVKRTHENDRIKTFYKTDIEITEDTADLWRLTAEIMPHLKRPEILALTTNIGERVILLYDGQRKTYTLMISEPESPHAINRLPAIFEI